MGDLLNNIVAICGFGALFCCGFIVAGFLLLILTGRAIVIPAVIAFGTQLFGGVAAGALGNFSNPFGGGDGGSTDDDDGPLRADKGLSASERVRRRREQFGDSEGSLAPDRRRDDPFDIPPPGQGGSSRRGPIGGDSAPDSTPSADDILGPPRRPGGLRSNPNSPRRDTRRTERNDDEIFGGMLDDDGDGHADF